MSNGERNIMDYLIPHKTSFRRDVEATIDMYENADSRINVIAQRIGAIVYTEQCMKKLSMEERATLDMFYNKIETVRRMGGLGISMGKTFVELFNKQNLEEVDNIIEKAKIK